VKYSNECGDKYQFIATYSVFEGYNESCVVNRDTCYDLQYLYQNHPIGKTMDISFDPNCNEACDTQYYTEQKANNSYPIMKSSWISMWGCVCGLIFATVFGTILIFNLNEAIDYLTTPPPREVLIASLPPTVLPRRCSREVVVTTPNPSRETVIQKDVTLAPTTV
jgi:hypothetical protein